MAKMSKRPKAHMMIPPPDMSAVLPPPGSPGTPPNIGPDGNGPIPPLHVPNMGPSMTRLAQRGKPMP